VVAVSQAVASRVINGPVRVIYAGLPVPPGGPPAHRPACELVIGTAGRLVELKGIEYLLNATAQLLHEFPNLRLEIAGTGPQRERLQAAAAHAGLGEHVRFLGWIDEIAPVLRGWDVFVMPSLEEGFPIAALDAMSAGLPVVATAVGGVPELIEDSACGFLIPPRDVESLVSRLRMLLASAEMRSRIGEAGYIRVRDHFSNAKMTESFAHLYDELLDKQSV
jgi:glycosyltransferase involved in cell wall biosynthesis